jgi:hypothetical protein
MALPQNFYDAVAVFKQMYLPVWGNLVGIKASALMSKIKNYQITGGGEIEATAQVGFNGGYGALANDLRAPIAGRNIYEKFKEKRKRMAVTLRISDEAIQASANDKLAVINLLDAEIKSGFETAKWNVGRALFGNGSGILSPVASFAGNTATLPIDGTELPNNIKEGLTIDIYKADGTVAETNCRIVSVDRNADPITFTFNREEGPAVSLTQTGGFITNQLSYNNEITGLGAIFDDAIPALYGINKAATPLIKPIVADAEGDINDSIINKVLRSAQRDRDSEVDMLLMGDESYDHYVEYLRVNNLRNEKADLTLEGGFKAINFLFSNSSIPIVNEGFVPKNEVWGVDSKTLGMYQLNDWDFVAEGGSAFTLMPGWLAYNAVIAKYGNLICTKPGGCVRITNASGGTQSPTVNEPGDGTGSQA